MELAVVTSLKERRARNFSVEEKIILVEEYWKRGKEIAREFAERKGVKLTTLKSIVRDDSKSTFRTATMGKGLKAKVGSRSLSLEEQGQMITMQLKELKRDGADFLEVRPSTLGKDAGLGLFTKIRKQTQSSIPRYY